MPESFSISQCIDFVSVPRILVRDSSISPQARFLYIAALSLGDGCSKYSVMQALGVSDFRYRGMVRELEDAGYIVRHQRRGECGTFGISVLELTLPKPRISTGRQFADELLRRQNPRSEPHIKNFGAAEENHGKSRNPRSEPHIKNCSAVASEPQNPRSEPHIKNCGAAGDFPIIEKQQQPGGIQASNPEGRCEGKWDAGIGYSKVRGMVSRDSGYVLRNISEKEFDILYEVIAGACSDGRFGGDQRILCRPLIDSMCDGIGFEYILGAVGFLVGQQRYSRSALPSYWVADFSRDVRDAAGKMAPDADCDEPVEFHSAIW